MNDEENTEYKDKIGRVIKVGDFVAYAIGGRSDTNVYFGVVEKIKTDGGRWNSGPMIRPYPDGRLLSTPRSDGCILVLNNLREQNAEYFI